MEDLIRQELEGNVRVMRAVSAGLAPRIAAAAKLVIDAFRAGNRLFLFGNGGSAADAQHIAAEFTGRFARERRALPAIALTTNSSDLTAIGNDYGFARVFSRQLEALAAPGDIALGFSTSGNSPNVVEAFRAARSMKVKTIALTGKGGGALADLADINIVVPSDSTPRIQEAHITIGHIICLAVEEALFKHD